MRKLIFATEVTKKFRISYQTLNHYTNFGLLRSKKRKGFKRLYDKEEVKQRLARIRQLQNKGYTLKSIAGIINK